MLPFSNNFPPRKTVSSFESSSCWSRNSSTINPFPSVAFSDRSRLLKTNKRQCASLRYITTLASLSPLHHRHPKATTASSSSLIPIRSTTSGLDIIPSQPYHTGIVSIEHRRDWNLGLFWVVVSTQLNGAYDVFATPCSNGAPSEAGDVYAEQ